jgi:hypothetical protein
MARSTAGSAGVTARCPAVTPAVVARVVDVVSGPALSWAGTLAGLAGFNTGATGKVAGSEAGMARWTGEGLPDCRAAPDRKAGSPPGTAGFSRGRTGRAAAGSDREARWVAGSDREACRVAGSDREACRVAGSAARSGFTEAECASG